MIYTERQGNNNNDNNNNNNNNNNNRTVQVAPIVVGSLGSVKKLGQVAGKVENQN